MILFLPGGDAGIALRFIPAYVPNGGVNQTPRTYNPESGLSRPEPPPPPKKPEP